MDRIGLAHVTNPHYLSAIILVISITLFFYYLPLTDQQNNLLSIADIKGSNKPALLGFVMRGPQTSSTYLELNLYWYSDQPLDRDYKVFTWFTDPDSKEILINCDHWPTIPTTKWRGLIKDSPHYVILPSNMTPSDYPGLRHFNLIIGLYDANNNQRAELANENLKCIDPYAYDVGSVTVCSADVHRYFIQSCSILIFLIPLFVYFLVQFRIDNKKAWANILFGSSLITLMAIYPIGMSYSQAPLRYLFSIAVQTAIAILISSIWYISGEKYLAAVFHLTLLTLLGGLFIISKLTFPLGEGDINHHMAIVLNVLNGGILTDPLFRGEPNWYSNGFHSLIAIFSTLFHIDFRILMIFLPPFIRSSTVIALYFLGRYLVDERFGLLFSFLGTFFNSWSAHYGLQALPKGFLVFTPLIIYTYLKSDVGLRRYAVFAGLLLLAQAWTHTLIFLNIFLALMVDTFTKLVINRQKAKMCDFLVHTALVFGPSLVFELSLLVPLWMKYHGVIQNDIFLRFFRSSDFDPNFFLNLKGFWPNSILSIGTFVGLILWLITRERFDFMTIFFFVTIALRFSYLITFPSPINVLVSVVLDYNYAIAVLSSFFSAYLVFSSVKILEGSPHYGGKHVADLLSLPEKTRKSISHNGKMIPILTILLASTGQVYDYVGMGLNMYQHNIRFLPPDMVYPLCEWIELTTASDSVFLANTFWSTAISSLTGRKVVTMDAGHSNPYVNMEKRNSEGMEVFSSTNQTRIVEILKKFSVNYIVVDYELTGTPDNLKDVDFLTLVYHDHHFNVYQVYMSK